MANQPPLFFPGFFHRGNPTSAREALSRQAFGAARKIAKAALVDYIRSHFDGEFKDMFRAVCPQADGFITDLNSSERMQIPVLLARKYPDLLSRTPAIVINAKKGRILPTSIAGGLEGGAYSSALDQILLQLTSRKELHLEVYVASTDPDQADALEEAVELILTVLRTITRTAKISSKRPGDQWTLLLPPQAQVDVDGPVETPLQGSTRDSFWSYVIDLPCTFEGNVLVRNVQRTSGQPVLQEENFPPPITTTLPATIPVGTTFKAFIQNRPLQAVFRSSDQTIAQVDFDGHIRALRLGSFQFEVVQPREGGLVPDVLFSQQVQVVP